MIGSLAFAVSHFLFAEAGTYFLCFVLFIIGFILMTGTSISEIVGKALEKVMYLLVKRLVVYLLK